MYARTLMPPTMMALVVLATFFIAIPAQPVSADPCGMVPPIFTGNVSPITRIGLQKTYVFYKDGVESFVIRPGFQGDVDNFGMLIAFPTAPELRKVPDNVFDHVVNAVDPPEVVVDLRIRMQRGAAFGAPMATAESAPMNYKSDVSRLVVLKQEAVGMYQVAVLEAGSAAALKKWMEQNGYQYPKGMDKVTNEYVKDGWCFVAVKTKVGSKSNVSPRPGQRRVRPEIPKGSTFDGHVQGMGFRFKTDQLVVPMRLSAFNGGDTRNVVYLLTDSPQKVRAIPEEFVQRQIAGSQLLKNVTQPLPLRIIGGTEADIPKWQRDGMAKRRDPAPHNAMAKEMFASDLLAVSSGQLSLEHEEQEKELLRIGEHFGLRGGEIDGVNALAIAKEREQVTSKGLEQLAGMTLTLVDGDFPREVIANQNLTFAEYKMPRRRNTTLNYEAGQFGPGKKKEGILKVGLIDWNEVDQQVAAKAEQKSSRRVASSAVGVIALGLMFSFFFRRRVVTVAALLLATMSFGLVASTVDAAVCQESIKEMASIKWGNYDLAVNKTYNEAKGKIGKIAGSWMIEPDGAEGGRLLTQAIDAEFQTEGMEVTFSGYCASPPPNVRMAGSPFQLVSIRKFGAPAAEKKMDEKTEAKAMDLPKSPDKMLEMLKDSKTAKVAIAAIDQHCRKSDGDREQMVRQLLNIVKTDKELPKRGWAVAALAEVGGQDVDEYLLNIHADTKQEMVVRTWCAAARVSMTRTANGLIEKANLIQQFPALGRPIGIRLVEKMSGDKENIDVGKVLDVSMKVPQLQSSLAPMIIGFGPEKLMEVMYTSKNDNVRRQATGYLGSIANQGKSSEVAELVTERLTFKPDAKKAAWDGGALFIPGIQWGKEEARSLVGQLIRWHVWCDVKGDANGQRQIHNNIRGVGLARAAGYQSPGWNDTGTVTWLESWGNAVGRDEIEAILKEQNVADKPKYKAVLDGLK